MTTSLPLRAAAPAIAGLSAESAGMLLGLTGVAIFSLTLPFTRMAVSAFDPAFVAFGRAVVAALLAACWLAWRRAPLPPRAALAPLAMVAGGCIIGFPSLTSIAMRSVPASHGAVLIGVLPLATAVFAVLRGGERPSGGFWIMAGLGTALVAGFALHDSGGSFHLPDLALLAAALLLKETLSWSNVLFALAVIAVVAAGRRMRVKRH